MPTTGNPLPARARALLHRCRGTIRIRLTLLYGGLFLVAGAGVLAITYLLFVHATGHEVLLTSSGGKQQLILGHPGTSATLTEQQRTLQEQAARQRSADLHQLLIQSGIALAIMAILAIAMGWLVAGRVLRPLRAMTTKAQQISQHNLYERLAVEGPGDEVRDLADTIDGLLGRLQTAFEAQRRFVANVSHELRTPLTWERALVEISLADPEATTATLRGTLEELLASGQDQERLIEALLTLASSERGLDQYDAVDLASLVGDALQPLDAEARCRGLVIATQLDRAPASGNAALLKRLVTNLVDNAVGHNNDHGRIEIRTTSCNGHGVLTVANTGPLVPPDEVERLQQPFQRLAGERNSHPDGHGLGLSIVRAIATAHNADLHITPNPAGGLHIEVRFNGTGLRPVALAVT